MPEGILNLDALVSVAKETDQAAKTILVENIVNMRARLWASGRTNSVWLINQDIEPQLHLMSLPVGTGGIPVYMPAGGLSGTPFDTLYGRPVIPIEQCSTLGTVGDIILTDLTQYIVGTRGTLEGDMSMHLKFDYRQMAFRWIMEIDGQSRWASALAPFKGNATASKATLSPFIVLAARA